MFEGSKVKGLQARFSAMLSLDEIGQRLKEAQVIQGYAYNEEAVYEWIECGTNKESVKVNFSRRHFRVRDFSREPISVVLTYTDEEEPADGYIKKLALILARTFKQPVEWGMQEEVEETGKSYFKVSGRVPGNA
jgi:hypothetical protein